MKLTESGLRKIIVQELKGALNEMLPAGSPHWKEQGKRNEKLQEYKKSLSSEEQKEFDNFCFKNQMKSADEVIKAWNNRK